MALHVSPEIREQYHGFYSLALDGTTDDGCALVLENVPAAGLPALPPYLLVLGAKRSALPLLKHAKIPAGTSLAGLAGQDPKLQIAADMHSKAVDFSLLCRYKIQPMGLAYTAHVVLL